MMADNRRIREPVRDNPDQPLLSVRNLGKSFQGLQAVADVNMDLASGQVIGIIGPNGSGKSTTINLICGFLKPDSGQISLRGRTVTGLSATDMAEQGVSRTFQNGRVFPTMSVEENVAVGFHRRLEARRPFRRLERWPILRWIPLLTQTWLTLVPGPACRREAVVERKAVQSEIDRFSERLEEHRTQAAYTLSYANRRRTEIARAHVSSPDILVLDEPTAGMNQSETAEVLQQLLELKAQGQTMLLVEHKIDLIEALCDQVIAMDGGRIIASGPPRQVSADPRVITAYLGDRRPRNDAPMNGQADVLARQNALAPVTAAEPIDGQDPDSAPTRLRAKAEASDDEGKPTAEGERTLLSLDGVDVSYGPVKALDHVSLRIPQGGIVSLLGGNASGKSTTMKTILGLLAPKKGTIHLDGREITHTPTKDRVRSGIASVPEARRVFAAMSVEENLRMGAYTQRERNQIEQDLDAIYERFPRLAERRGQQAGTLSGGEQQMLAFGRALMSHPRLICMDEPTMGLSPKLVDQVLEQIVSLRDQLGISILLVEQQAELALSIADYGYVLQNGLIRLEGPARKLLNDERVRQAYLGKATSR